ncbi:MAG: hypothetical protein AAB425_11045 [Bdellovibrionota bacterium]
MDSLKVAFLVECFFVTTTAFLLVQPGNVFSTPPAEGPSKTVTLLGTVLLGVTFCWSIVVGSLLALRGLILQ